MNIDRKYIFLMLLTGAIVALDQATKIYIHTQFRLGESLPVIQDFFHITYVRNTGAAFGILRATEGDLSVFGLFSLSIEFVETLRKGFFLVMPPAAITIIFFILRGVSNTDRIQVFALSSIFGGALGNYIDRLRFGYVVDFLDFHWKDIYTYPAFNIADSAIVCGSAILGWLIFVQWREERRVARLKGA